MIDSSTIAGALTVETAKMYILLIKFLTKKKREESWGESEAVAFVESVF